MLERSLSERVQLAQQAAQQWQTLGPVVDHPHFLHMCQRIIDHAQAQLAEVEADKEFESGLNAHQKGQDQEARSKFDRAFNLYVRALQLAGRGTAFSHERYLRYMNLVTKLERRFYDLPDMKLIHEYSQYVQTEWLSTGESVSHPAVPQACRRVQQVADLAKVPSNGVRDS